MMFPQEALDNRYKGASLFLALSGPSLVNVETIPQLRGCLVMAVNNAWSVVRPHLWVGVDSPEKFCYEGWSDPAIQKFVPTNRMGQPVRKMIGDDLVFTNEIAADMPNVTPFKLGLEFNSETFIDEPCASWGCRKNTEDDLGVKACRSVMLVAVKLAIRLGFKTIYLMGADFRMEEGEDNYAFEQDTGANTVNGNNNTYEALNARFAALRPLFEERGVTVLNTTEGSGLEAFDYIPLSEALERETVSKPGTFGYYDASAQAGVPTPRTINYESLYNNLYNHGYHSRNKYCSYAFNPMLKWCEDNLDYDSCLDIGCSYGGAVRDQQRDGKDSWGVDVARVAVDSCIKDGFNVKLASATDLPFGDRSIDLVYTAETFEHLTPSDAILAIDEMIRVSKRYIAVRVATQTDKNKEWRRIAGQTLHQTVCSFEWWVNKFRERAKRNGKSLSLILESNQKNAPVFIFELRD